MVALLKGCQQCSEINIHGDCVWGVVNTQYKSDIDDMINLAARANSLVNALNIKLTKKGYATYKVGIGIDYGRQAQITAAKIVKEHVKYYETKMGYQAQIDKIAEQYLQGVDTNDLKYQPASSNKTPVRGKVAKNKTDMTRELGQKLRTMYEMSGVNKVAMIQLFGILEADTIENNGVRVPDIVKEAGLSDSYKTEVSKGIKLAKYVQLKPEYKDMF